MTSRFEKVTAEAIATLEEWYDEQRAIPGEEPERYVIAAAIAVLECFPRRFPLTNEDYVTPGSQVRTSGKLIQKVLARFGEHRTFSREGGRTTRGTRPAAESFAARLNALPRAEKLTPAERARLAEELQRRLAARATAYLDRGRLEVEIVLAKPTPAIIADILAAASEKNLAGAVAQHLVGAKLALRFADQEIENHSYTTADAILGRTGDFQIGDTAIHVTIAPMQSLFERCAANLRAGLRSLLLVPADKREAAKQLADIAELAGRIDVATIESFVGQNVDEMSGFKRDGLRIGIADLLRKYNERVEAVETNPGLLIEVPEL